MNQLITKKDFPQLIENAPLNQKTKDIYKSNNGISIRQSSDMNFIVNTIHTLINQTLMDKGSSLEIDEITYIKTRVVDDIMKEFRQLTLEDIKLAFYYGVRGEFGEYYGINSITFYNWLKAYKNDTLPKVYNDVKPYLKKIESNEPKIDQTEVERGMVNSICDVYFLLVTEGVYDFFDIGNIHYSFMDRLGLINLNQSEWNEVYLIAKGKVKESLSEKNAHYSKTGKTMHKIQLSTAFEEIENGSNMDYNSMIEIAKKKVALQKTLYKYAESEIDLYNLLFNKLGYERNS